jgi:hypothetical protein
MGQVSHAGPPQQSVVETKVAASSAAGIVTGLLSWALVAFIPVFKSGIPGELQPFLPVAAGWLVATAAGYLAPHTHRPDLGGLVVLAPAAEPCPARHARPADPAPAVSAAPTPDVPAEVRAVREPTNVHPIPQPPATPGE